MQQLKNCPNCGGLTAQAAAFCPKCGYSWQGSAVPVQQQAFTPSIVGTQSAAAAMMLSLFIPGGGAFYNHQRVKAVLILFSPFLLFFGGLMCLALVRATAGIAGLISLLMWISIPGVWIAQVVDAAVIAGRINRGESVGPMQWF